MLKRRCPLGDHYRVTQGEAEDARPDREGFGFAGDERQRGKRIQHRGRVRGRLNEVVDEPCPGEVALLGECDVVPEPR